MEVWKLILEFLGPVLVAAVTIIPTIINNRKKTENSIRAMVDEIKEENNKIDQKVDALSTQFAKHVREDEDNNAKQVRIRILRFYDELCEGKPRSENHFDDILDDIDYYEQYVVKHPTFKNNRGEAAMNYIRDRYRIEKEAGGFLKHT